LAARSLFVYFERSAACPKLQRDAISLGVCVVGRFREVFWLRRRISDASKVTQTESAFLTQGAAPTHALLMSVLHKRKMQAARENKSNPTTLHQHTGTVGHLAHKSQTISI
jgi:hypothetical protein